MPEVNGKLRVLQVHNHYSPGWGGEDTVVELEARLLRNRGHAVDEFKASTAALKHATAFRQMMAVPSFLWSRRSYQGLCQKISEFQPDVVHVHNTFPILSPSVFWAGHRAGVPVVQTLHNFRPVCANALLLREGRRCEKCVGHAPFPASAASLLRQQLCANCGCRRHQCPAREARYLHARGRCLHRAERFQWGDFSRAENSPATSWP